VRKIKLSNKLLEKLIRTTRQGEHEVRSQGAHDRRALTGEAGNASRRQVMVGAAARSPESAIAWRTQDESGPTFSRVMRTNFVGTTPKIFREHSDSLVLKKTKSELNPFKKKKLFFNCPKMLVDDQSLKNELKVNPLKDKLAHLILESNETGKVEKLYQEYIQNNKLNECAYRHFYNKLSAKIDILKIISVDKGKNIALVPNLVAKLLCLLTYSVEIASSHLLSALGAGSRHGINKISEGRKIRSAKNKLQHCITDHKFIRLLSILLTTMHALDIPTEQKKIDSFVDEHFLYFWSLFKKQAKLSPNTENLNGFWSTCLFIYFKELKSPLIQNDFDQCLNKMTATLQDVDYSIQLKNIMEISPENYMAFFQLFTLQTAAVQCYITQVLEQLVQAANASKSCDSLTSFGMMNRFYQDNNASPCSLIPPITYEKYSPRLIAASC
jgi:hypothetical protein